ncbi:biotin--[acetyl-CoA-carboxylase] ligase [Georgenia sunbinii]|uniref:biotin--[acetyl-CoA-carboxylase] ligase n=1 Tax=Georgenia sunbinii TaxID=3117728 RepID=UPI002F25FA5E
MNDAPFSRLLRLPQVASTNTVLRESVVADPAAWPHLSALIADHQTAGRGRTGRQWHTPAGTALTASIVLRPLVATERLGWLTLLTGLAAIRALRALAPDEASRLGLKWPNDVLVDGADTAVDGWGRQRKVAGILAEVVPGTVSTPATPDAARAPRASRAAVVVGLGVNLRQREADLPVPWATSLERAGIGAPGHAPSPLELLRAVGHELEEILTTWEGAGGDVAGSGLRDAVRDVCVTLGDRVQVAQPGGGLLSGTAEDIDDEGRLVVVTAGGARVPVVAGDVSQLRNP